MMLSDGMSVCFLFAILHTTRSRAIERTINIFFGTSVRRMRLGDSDFASFITTFKLTFFPAEYFTIMTTTIVYIRLNGVKKMVEMSVTAKRVAARNITNLFALLNGAQVVMGLLIGIQRAIIIAEGHGAEMFAHLFALIAG